MSLWRSFPRSSAMRWPIIRRGRRGNGSLDRANSMILVNVLLAVFNMIPLPPLDGGRVAVGLLPDALALPLARTERYGILILITLLIVCADDRRVAPQPSRSLALCGGSAGKLVHERDGSTGRAHMSELEPFEEARPSSRSRPISWSISTAMKGRSTCCCRWRASRRSISPSISILALADQFLAFIAAARRLKLEIAADYLVMAAWLAYLKSRLLLPQPPAPDEPSGAELAAALTQQLQRLEAMQQAGIRLMARPQLGRDVFRRGAPEGLPRVLVPVWDVSLYDLLKRLWRRPPAQGRRGPPHRAARALLDGRRAAAPGARCWAASRSGAA